MRQADRFLMIGFIALLGTGCAGHLAYASDAYRGKVIDAETRQPLVGAVVLAIWYREVPVAPHGPAVDYHDALEVLTDAQGEFTVPAKTHVTPIGKIREPEFVVFYPGYALYPSIQARPQGKAVTEAYERRYFPVELVKLKTREERMEGIHGEMWVSKVPEPKMPNLVRLVNQERRNLGLQPIRLGR